MASRQLLTSLAPFIMHKISILFFVVCVSSLASAEVTAEKTSWVKYYPYVAEKNEYQAEVGSMWEKTSLYWLGITYGHLTGQCVFFDSSNCTQYIDLTGGFGNRDAVTHTTIVAGPRWQFSRGNSSFAPLIRVFAGAVNTRDDERGRTLGTFGLGAGFAARVHPRLDVKTELRVGQADFLWATAMITFSMHLDHVLESTIQTTGSILKTTIEAPKTFVDWFNKKEEKQKETK